VTGKPPDPLGPPDPARPDWVPDDWPRFYLAEPMPEPAKPGTCPHCTTAWLSGRGRHAVADDVGVCATCLNLCIATEDGGWRIAGYDEAEKWDADPRVRAMRAIWGKDLPP
jgi:hypothetical protein